MEGATMIFVSVDPHSLMCGSPIDDTLWFSLSYSCAQMADSDTLARLKGPSPAMLRARHARVMLDIIDLFLDFVEKLPHSSSQITTYAD
jgi:hypothetical protein